MKWMYHHLLSILFIQIAHHQKDNKDWAIWMSKAIVEHSKAVKILEGEN